MKLRLSFLLVVLAVSGCASPSSPTVPASLGTEFTLKAGETARMEGTDLGVTFHGVPNDSRCPADVVCIQAGDAVVALRVGTAEVQLRSHTAPEREVGIYRVRVTRVEPYPYSSQPIAAADYRAALLVTRR